MTTRILVVDLLSGRLHGQHVSGIVVLNAHRVSDTSGDGFAVRLYRAANRNGFVRAFSDQPPSFLGFSKVGIATLNNALSVLTKGSSTRMHVASMLPKTHRRRRFDFGFLAHCGVLHLANTRSVEGAT